MNDSWYIAFFLCRNFATVKTTRHRCQDGKAPFLTNRNTAYGVPEDYVWARQRLSLAGSNMVFGRTCLCVAAAKKKCYTNRAFCCRL